MDPLISFVLPAYKAKYFKEAVDSILSQTYTNFELIIVNDCSPENLDAIVAQYNDKRIKYYKNEKNIGGTDLVAQWNHCITFAKGEYLVLASDDDMYYPNYLEELVPLTQKYPNINVFRPRVEHIDGNNNITGVEGYLPEFVSQLEFAYLLFSGNIYHGIPYYIFNTQALKDIGGFVRFPLAVYSDDATVIALAKNSLVSNNKILFSFRADSGINISSRKDKNIIKQKVEASILFVNWVSSYNFLKKDKYYDIYKESILNSFHNGDHIYDICYLSLFNQIQYLKRCTFINKKTKIIILAKCFFKKLQNRVK